MEARAGSIGYWLLYLVCRLRQEKQSRKHSRSRKTSTAGPHVDRDRFALSCASAASRQAQRAGLCGEYRRSHRPVTRKKQRRNRQANDRKLLSAVSADALSRVFIGDR